VATEWVVTDPTNVRYRVRIGRSGVPRYNPMGGLPGLVRWATGLLRSVLRTTRRWSVEVVPVSAWRAFYDPVLDEDYADRASANRRASEVIDSISAGKLRWDGPWSQQR
jgi:hypothetical protein